VDFLVILGRARQLFDSGSVGLRQDDAPAHDRRIHRAGMGRRTSHRRHRRHARCAAEIRRPVNMAFQPAGAVPDDVGGGNVALDWLREGTPRAERLEGGKQCNAGTGGIGQCRGTSASDECSGRPSVNAGPSPARLGFGAQVACCWMNPGGARYDSARSTLKIELQAAGQAVPSDTTFRLHPTLNPKRWLCPITSRESSRPIRTMALADLYTAANAVRRGIRSGREPPDRSGGTDPNGRGRDR